MIGGEVDMHSDLCSLSMALWQMLTSHLPLAVL